MAKDTLTALTDKKFENDKRIAAQIAAKIAAEKAQAAKDR